MLRWKPTSNSKTSYRYRVPMQVRPPQPRAINPIQINVRSEVDTLKVVAMCWANPYSIGLGSIAASFFNTSVYAQLRHNTWKVYDHVRVREQQQGLIQVLHDHGVTVQFLDNVPGISSQHYTRDIAFCIDDVFFVARMGTRYREPEQRALATLLPRLSRVVQLERGRIEGGDVMLYGDKVLVGLGEATDTQGVDALRHKLAELSNPREVVAIPFAHRGVIHLDTKFNIVGNNVALIARKSFRPDTLRWFEKHFDLIEATDEEANRLEINTFAIGGGRVIVRETSERLAKRIQDKGLTPVPLDYSEVAHWPGSFRCTTLPLERVA